MPPRPFSVALLKAVACWLLLSAASTTLLHAQAVLDGFDPNANGTIRVAVVQADGKILIGGEFTTLAPNGGAAVARNYIARLNTDGSLDTAFNPNANNFVLSLAVQTDGKVLAGGTYSTIGGQARNSLARLDATTGAADAFDPNANSFVQALAVQSDGKIVAGGAFTSIGGQARNFIARLDPTTGLADSFNPNANNVIRVLTLQSTDGKILAGGLFSNIGGQARSFIARLDATTGLADSFNPNANNFVRAIAVQGDGKILAGGLFSGTGSIGGQARNFIARLDPTTGAADAFNPNANAEVRALALQTDGKILAGGDFSGANGIGGQTRNFLARLDATNGAADTFDPNANSFVRALAVQADGGVIVGGLFTTLAPDGGAAVTRNRIARLNGAGPTPPATFTPLSPARVWDSRFGPGPTGQIGAGQTRNVTVTGIGGVPATGVTAVVLNITAVNPSAQTFATVWPTGEGRPLAANLNVPPGDVRANLVIVKVGTSGQVSVFNNSGNVDFVADVAGWYGPASGQRYTAVSPSRVWDSRSGPGPTGQIGAGQSRNVTVTGLAGVPATGVTAVVLNVTAINPSARTFITAWPAGEAQPLAANLNAPIGDVRANLVIVKVGAGGQVSFFNNSGNVDLVADVAGYYSGTGSLLHSVSPSRIWDSRFGPGPVGQIGPAGVSNLTVTGVGGVPATGVTAVVLNVTAVSPSARTFITAWPTGEAQPLAANLNAPIGDVRANLVIVKVGANGQVSFYNNSGNVNLVADVAGWYGPPGE